MSEEDILELIRTDEWMMNILRTAEKLDLKDWAIGAGFIRNKVWDHLHGYNKETVDTNDIDLVYFDPNGNDEEADEELSRKLKEETGINYEVVNEFYAHKWNKLPPYKSTEDAISQFPETVTAIGVRLKNGELSLVKPYGVEDIVNMIIRPTPMFFDKIQKIKDRVKTKQWIEKYPKLKFSQELDLVYIDEYGLLGSNFYFHKYESKGLTKEDILDAGLTSDRVQVHQDIIEPLISIDQEFQKRGLRLYIKEGYRSEKLYNVVYKRRVEKF